MNSPPARATATPAATASKQKTAPSEDGAVFCIEELRSFQQMGGDVQLAAGDGHQTVRGAAGIADAAGIEEKGLAPPVHQRAVGVTEEEHIQILLLGGKTGGEKGLLDAVGMAVAQQHAVILHKYQPLRRLSGTEVAVAGHLVKGDVRETVVEAFAVPPAVSQVEDHPRGGARCRLLHISHVSVGV